MINKKLNFFGEEIKIIFYKDWDALQRVHKKDGGQNSVDGFCNLLKRTIHVYLHNYQDKIIFCEIEKVIWHEVGHLVEELVPSAIMHNELVSSCYEYVPNLVKEVNRIMREIKKEQ